MSTAISKESCDVVILCGGKGTRLQPSVSDRPKPMAEVRGKPFLDWLIAYVATFGFHRFILCTGYMSENIESYFKSHNHERMEILISREAEFLGTGGAVKKALLSHCPDAESVVVLNGDTFCRIDYDRFLEFHATHEATVSIAVSAMAKRGDHGFISLDADGKIDSFCEKSQPEYHQYSSSGVYLMRKEVLDLMPSSNAFSLEFDLFPGLAEQSSCYGYVTGEGFLDIGTPERYDHARNKGF